MMTKSNIRQTIRSGLVLLLGEENGATYSFPQFECQILNPSCSTNPVDETEMSIIGSIYSQAVREARGSSSPVNLKSNR